MSKEADVEALWSQMWKLFCPVWKIHPFQPEMAPNSEMISWIRQRIEKNNNRSQVGPPIHDNPTKLLDFATSSIVFDAVADSGGTLSAISGAPQTAKMQAAKLERCDVCHVNIYGFYNHISVYHSLS